MAEAVLFQAFTEDLEIFGLERSAVFGNFLEIGVGRVLPDLMRDDRDVRNPFSGSIISLYGFGFSAVLDLNFTSGSCSSVRT
ncbi:hypothetical protein D3C80_1329550 [compost metagenome]